ncbi:hypothetical protein SDC9_185695 [bioreactor metagenome]|uniref:Uncharacterized protein n=1 Tax=bioreactor metagenome TaxID=1076179 RepID=A0A645HGL8_9ZZZZ
MLRFVLEDIGLKRQRAVFWRVLNDQPIAQQHGQPLGHADRAARAHQRGQIAVAELPLRRFFVAAADVVKHRVEFVKRVIAQRRVEVVVGCVGCGVLFSHGRKRFWRF